MTRKQTGTDNQETWFRDFKENIHAIAEQTRKTGAKPDEERIRQIVKQAVYEHEELYHKPAVFSGTVIAMIILGVVALIALSVFFYFAHP